MKARTMLIATTNKVEAITQAAMRRFAPLFS